MSGEAGRDSGIAQVLAATPERWKNQYLTLTADWFADLPRGRVFNGEALRLNAEEKGLDPPPHHNAWGGVANGYLRALLSLGLVERYEVTKAVSAKAHARSYPSYRKI